MRRYDVRISTIVIVDAETPEDAVKLAKEQHRGTVSAEVVWTRPLERIQNKLGENNNE